MKKLLPIAVFLFAFCLASCNKPAENPPEVTTAASAFEPAETAAETTTFATIATLDNVTWTTTAEPDDGFAHAVLLENLGLSLVIPADMPNRLSPYQKKRDKANPPLPGEITPSIWFIEDDLKAITTLSLDPKQVVCATIENLDPQAFDVGNITVLVFQLFRVEDLEKYKQVRASAHALTLEQIKERIICQTDEFVAYDFTDYYNGGYYKDPVSFEDYAKQVYPDGHPDLEWATSVRKYYLENLDKALVAVE